MPLGGANKKENAPEGAPKRKRPFRGVFFMKRYRMKGMAGAHIPCQPFLTIYDIYNCYTLYDTQQIRFFKMLSVTSISYVINGQFYPLFVSLG